MEATASFALQNKSDQSQVLRALEGCNIPRIFSADPVTDILEIVRTSLSAFNTEKYVVQVSAPSSLR